MRERWQARDPSLVEGMQLIASLAEKAAEALRARDFDVLASLMEKNFATRRELYGDAVVGAKNIAVAELLKAHHIAAKFTGSGGAFVCLKKENPMQWYKIHWNLFVDNMISSVYCDLGFLKTKKSICARNYSC